MITKRILEKSDKLIYSIFMNLKLEEAQFILEKDSIKEEEIGTKLTILEPITEWTKTSKIEKNKRREFLITKTGNVEVLKNIIEEKEEESINDFVNRTIYKLESCKEDLFRMTKEKSSITLVVREDSDFTKTYKVVTPSIIYLNDEGQVLDFISQNVRITEGKENKVKSR